MTKPRADTARPASRFAPHAVRLAALWLLAGAASKAVSGMPTDLPWIFQSSDRLDPQVVLTVGVFVEIAVAVLALAAPAVGRIPLAALLALFAAILVHHMASTDASCGCFGGANIPAPAMLLADLAFLGLTAWTMRAPMQRPTAVRLATISIAALLLALAAAWFADGRITRALGGESAVTDGGGGSAAPGASSATSAPPPWSLPTTIPEQVLLRPLQWVGKRLADTPLGTWVDTSPFPPKARLIFFYRSCNHCADLLARLATEQAANPAAAPTYVLVQLPTPPAYKGRLFVDKVPEHARWVELPSVVKAYVMTPPWIVDIADGTVVAAERIPWPGEKNAATAK
ncbi:MAG: MauE/DoxX family redox-associated membrane protein [Phycisphaerales bacterium]